MTNTATVSGTEFESGKWSDVPAGTIKAAQDYFWSAIGDHAERVAIWLRNEPSFLHHVAYVMTTGGRDVEMSQIRASDIMGANFLGFDAVARCGIKLSADQHRFLVSVPYSEKVLKQCKDTHLLVMVPRISIVDMCGVDGCMPVHPEDSRWWLSEEFAQLKSDKNDKLGVGWYLIQKTSGKYPGSDKQDSGLPTSLASARVLMYAIMAYYLCSHHKQLFPGTSLRCSDRFRENGLSAHVGWDGGNVTINNQAFAFEEGSGFGVMVDRDLPPFVSPISG